MDFKFQGKDVKVAFEIKTDGKIFVLAPDGNGMVYTGMRAMVLVGQPMEIIIQLCLLLGRGCVERNKLLTEVRDGLHVKADDELTNRIAAAVEGT